MPDAPDPLRRAALNLQDIEDLAKHALTVTAELVVNAARSAPDESMSAVERRKYVRKLSFELLNLLPLLLRTLTELSVNLHAARQQKN